MTTIFTAGPSIERTALLRAVEAFSSVQKLTNPIIVMRYPPYYLLSNKAVAPNKTVIGVAHTTALFGRAAFSTFLHKHMLCNTEKTTAINTLPGSTLGLTHTAAVYS